MNTSDNDLNNKELQLKPPTYEEGPQRNKNSDAPNHNKKLNKMKSVELFRARTRFYLLFLLLLCLASVWSNILSFNFTLMFIRPDDKYLNSISSNQTIGNNNLTETSTTRNLVSQSLNASFSPDDDEENSQIYNQFQRPFLTAIVAFAALSFNFPIVSLINRFDIRSVFFVLGLISGISTYFLPVAIKYGFYYVLFVRGLQGIAFAVTFPAIGSFTSTWTYYKQNGLFVSALVAYIQLSPAITMPISGAICATTAGWPMVFHLHGLACILIFSIFALLYRNNPAKHPLVNKEEVNKIAVGKSELSKDKLKNIPYIQILKTPSVWAIWIAAFGNFFCVNMLFLYSHNYLRKVLMFPVIETGFSASIPPLAQFCIKLIAGITSDKVKFLSETNKLRAYNSLAFFGSAFFFILLAFAPTENATICVGLLGLAAGVLGFTTGGFFKAGPMVSKHYSHFVTGNVSLGITITMLIVPMMVTAFAPHHTAAGWRLVFLCTAAVLIITNSLFIYMCSALPASWTTDDFSKKISVKRNKVYSSTPTDKTLTTQPNFA